MELNRLKMTKYGNEIKDSYQIIYISYKNVNEVSESTELGQANNALETIKKAKFQ